MGNPSMTQTTFLQDADVFFRDACSALLLMARSPAFTVVAVLMIALGTGVNAAMFSVIDGVMLRTPFDEPDRIAIVRVVSPCSPASRTV
jgi:hypothetical protein